MNKLYQTRNSWHLLVVCMQIRKMIQQRDSHFFDNVVSKLSDIVVVTNKETGEIIRINPSFNALFEVNTEGMNIFDFFMSEKFEGDIKKAISNA